MNLINSKIYKAVFSFSILLCLLIASSVHASEVTLIYSDTPPGGDQYYTASIACSNLDGNPGDELVLTDDFGAFQVLSWDDVNLKFIERWVSDPVFEIHRIKNIYLPPVFGKDNAFLVFLDTVNDLHIFQWMEYIVSDVGVIHFDSAPGSIWVKDFTAGEFSSELTGWEVITLRTDSILFDGISFTYGIINTGHFKPELRQRSAAVILNIEEESHLEIIHCMDDKTQGLLLVSDNPTSEGFYSIQKTYPPFDKYKEFKLQADDIEKIGWTGQIDNSEISYLTYLIRQDDSDSKICFFRLDDNPATVFYVAVPSNTSKWVLGDIDSDGTRELIVLDFHGIISVYDLSDSH